VRPPHVISRERSDRGIPQTPRGILIRSKLDTGDSVYAFSLAHPSDDPGQTGLVSRLGERLTRAHALATQERTGHLTVHASVDNKDEIRALIRQDLLILAGIAELIVMDEPGLDARLELAAGNASHRVFLTGTQAILIQAGGRKDQFVAHGMPVTLLDDLATLVGHYEDAVEEKQAGTSAHVGANADLEAVVREIMLIIHLLDRLNTARFRRNAELLAAWRSAREVVGPARSGPEEEPPAGGGEEAAA
jgi:hypothetical protein